ncbi:response regulator transcription factor [Kineosporia babensis]
MAEAANRARSTRPGRRSTAAVGSSPPGCGRISRRTPSSAIRQTRSTTSPPGQADGRDRDVIRLLAQGLRTNEIALRLNFSERTIRNTIMALTLRSRLSNRAHLVGFGYRNGIL